MKNVTFYLDFVSPYAYLAFHALPQALEGCSYRMEYRPIVLGAVFKANAVPSPAQQPAKRDWIRRHTTWLAEQAGLTAFAPAVNHPFSSIPLSRMALACSEDGAINRYVANAVFAHCWEAGGADPLDLQRLDALRAVLQEQWQPDLSIDDEAIKQRLRDNTDAALANGLFGVPSFVVDGELLWGLDALPMLRARLLG